ncbi:MAG: hypothetical protein LBV41_01890 [Cytophagaceae bacterium]|jgi:thioredoxin-related protein|nr:hypothetical protein [Cytophagaceae bacterium]
MKRILSISIMMLFVSIYGCTKQDKCCDESKVEDKKLLYNCRRYTLIVNSQNDTIDYYIDLSSKYLTTHQFDSVISAGKKVYYDGNNRVSKWITCCN